jgi:sugar/nucleoside kinase (ribokinase family)
MTEASLDVVGIGNAIVDVLSEADEQLLVDHGLAKGTMSLIDGERADLLYSRLGKRTECSGGSAANTMVGIASLGGSSAYIGKVRDDALGRLFRDDIREAGVIFESSPAPAGPGTGRCLVLVTPDAQRTMQTYLGASATLTTDNLDPELISSGRITYLEGYLYDPPPAKEAFLEAARIAHGAGRKVALSLSDRFCVKRHRSEFVELIDSHIDILFANEDEIVSLYRTETFDHAVEALKGRCAMAALTRGAAGSVVLAGGETFRVEAEPVTRLVDTTGAGDLFASGFLFGLTDGRDPVACGKIGSIAAAEVVSHFGARPLVRLAELISV